MDSYNFVIQAISSVGFPIVMTLIMVYILYKVENNHREEMAEMMKSLENNTLAITKLTERLEGLIKHE